MGTGSLYQNGETFMFENIQWLFFDIGSTLIDEHMAYEHRFREIAVSARMPYDDIYNGALRLYKQNRKGDLEIAGQFGVELPKWHREDELLYEVAADCLKYVSTKYKIGIIANQSPGSKKRLEEHHILQYIDLVVASAEEGVSKPDQKKFEIALERSRCKPEHAIMIGDRIDNDIIPAKLSGMRTIWVKQGFGRYWNIENDDQKPDVVVNRLIELCDFL